MDKNELNQSKNILVIYELPENQKDNIFEYKIDASFSVFPNMPLLKYGFYYFIHQTKNKMEMFEKPELKNKELHKIINAFEDFVPQEDFVKQTKNDIIKPADDINSFSIKYFNSDRIISRAFYKLWELIMMFDLVPDKKNFISLHIAEAPGSFAQSVIYYRKKFFKKNYSTDKYIATSIEQNKSSDNGYVPSFNNDLTNNKQFSRWSYADSDLTKPNIIKKFIADNSINKADFITADGGFNWKDENFQEQEAYVLLLCEIYCALKCQANDGSFVIKFFETFTELTVKMIQILKQFYNKVYITKPLLSRPSNSERYIVCLNYKNDSTKNLDKIWQIIIEATSTTNTEKYLVDIFPEYQITFELDMVIKLSSTQMSNEQHRQINKMVSYFDNGNYYGNAYHIYLKNRREANDFWISVFYPNLSSIDDLKAARKVLSRLINNNLLNFKQTLDELKSKLSLIHY
jgi:23S rRNA U2552 (ribose-2'-O)-methylase RlmE/FtsJ